jgi:spore coat polysaccharide biosynthesis protein SpsF
MVKCKRTEGDDRKLMNTVAIVQARIGSSRLPGKVLTEIENKPMLWHQLNRMRRSRLIEETVVATTANSKDDVIQNFCERYKIHFFRGSENDVLDRYYSAAKLFNADAVVRITADCPLIDPEVIDKVIGEYLERADHFDGASNAIVRTYPRGLDTEVFSFRAIERAWREADKDYQREHVTIYMHENPESFKVFNVTNDEHLEDLRWTVDEEADLKFVREVYRALYKEGSIPLMGDILALLKKRQDIEGINKHVKQKAAL